MRRLDVAVGAGNKERAEVAVLGAEDDLVELCDLQALLHQVAVDVVLARWVRIHGAGPGRVSGSGSSNQLGTF